MALPSFQFYFAKFKRLMRESEDHTSTPYLIALMFWRVPTPKGCKDTTWTKQWTKHLRLCLLNLRFLLHMTCRAILFIMSLSILTLCLTFFHFFFLLRKAVLNLWWIFVKHIGTWKFKEERSDDMLDISCAKCNCVVSPFRSFSALKKLTNLVELQKWQN